ncbi:FG-GAP-like repeat-containing protein [Actinacidiphila oryziradicis]|uniref:VCBS repeat-containing protein n=1 Tax=Actinacidiphila oryziradicis TaxID=2571141 RepID=A0A4U0SJ66_9ACTN|nr:FG-GAP-like repeat-containing protein [Actinacidiphila oryziradicis]TKA08081.1 VCBS repeat-containing protein [Actinacidiphila oryziradicis]
MARRALVRGGIAAFAVLAVTGPGALSAPARAATTASAETVFQSDRYAPRADRIYSAGPTGYLHAQEGGSGYLWTRYDDGTTTELGELNRVEIPAYLGSSSDVVADYVTSPTQKVVLKDLAAGTATDVPITHGTYWSTLGAHVLTQAADADGHLVLWLYGGGAPDGGTLVDGWPTGITANFNVLGGDSGTAVVSYALAGAQHLALVDLAAAKVTGDMVVSAAPTAVALSADRLVWYASGNTAHVLQRDDLAAAETTVTLPGTEGTPHFAIAGGWLVTARSVPSDPHNMVDVSGEPLMAVPLAGGDPQTLLRHANTSVTAAQDGSVLVVGGADSAHWAVRRVTATGADVPVLSEVTAVSPVAATINRLSLENGTLATDEANSSFYGAYYTRPVATSGTTVTPGAATWRQWTHGGETGPWATGDGRSVTVFTDPDGASVQPLDPNASGLLRTGSTSGTVAEVTGGFVIVNGTNPTKQYVGDLDGEQTVTRSVSAASVWGVTLWTATSTKGVLKATNLQSDETTGTLSTGAPCVPTELQAVGRWIYWSCGPTGKAGIWDRTAKKNITVPSGTAAVGDGYLVRHDTTAGQLLLTDFADGTASTRAIGDLAGSSDGRGITWTVDKFGGPAAYVDAQNRIHLVPSGVATQPMTYLRPATTFSVASSSDESDWWQGTWTLSKPAASWTLTFRNRATGAVARTLTGGATSGLLDTRWNGRSASGAYVPNGDYTWQLTVRPADGSGAALTSSGTTKLFLGAAVRRDFDGTYGPNDGIGDLLTLNSSGGLTVQLGNGSGKFSGKSTGAGWPTTVTPVPYGDLNGDRCNDVLVRMAGGQLRAYKGDCGNTAFVPKDAYTSLGTGWNQYNVLTSPGDVTGDGRADLIARQSSTGDVYLYAATSAGKFATRVKIASKWTGYKKIVGAGDLNGDGYGDLLVQDKANVLWRYNGTASGKLAARVKVASGWGASYNAVVGVGDITGDGKADLVARDTSGNLYRQSGNGKGGFGARTKIATGWKAYKGIF